MAKNTFRLRHCGHQEQYQYDYYSLNQEGAIQDKLLVQQN